MLNSFIHNIQKMTQKPIGLKMGILYSVTEVLDTLAFKMYKVWKP